MNTVYIAGCEHNVYMTGHEYAVCTASHEHTVYNAGHEHTMKTADCEQCTGTEQRLQPDCQEFTFESQLVPHMFRDLFFFIF